MTDDLHYPMSCPFCGYWPVPVQVGKPIMWAARCQQCGAKGPPKDTPRDAMLAWDEVRFRRRMTDRDARGPDDDDGPKPDPAPVKPKVPELV